MLNVAAAETKTPMKFVDTGVRLSNLEELAEQQTCAICRDCLSVQRCRRTHDTIESEPRMLNSRQIKQPESMIACSLMKLVQKFHRNRQVQQKQSVHDPSITLACGHAFHRPCIQQWLKGSHTCPICREQLFSEVPAANSVHTEKLPCMKIAGYLAAVLVVAVIGGLANTFM